MKDAAPELPKTRPRIAAEAAIYSALVAAYLILVLSAVGPWLRTQSRGHPLLYALLCLGLMLGQGFVLELFTTLRLRSLSGRRR